MSINQPHYLPSRRYFDRIAKSDVHVVLDHVQFEKGSLVNRNRVMLPDGRITWLTVPVEKGKPINETRVVGKGWARKHSETLEQAYGFLFSPYDGSWLFQTCMFSMLDLAGRVIPGITRSLFYSSKMGGSKLGHKSDLVLNICKELGADQYLSGPFGRDYLDLGSFEREGIEVIWHDYDPGPGPELSVVHELSGRVAA